MLQQNSNMAVVIFGRIMCRLVGVVMVATMLVAQFASAQFEGVPVSRNAPYSVTIDALKLTSSKAVLATENYILTLEATEMCAITVRHRGGFYAPRPLWTANYFVGSLATSTKCTLKLTRNGDLQIWVVFMGSHTMIWNSNTANKGITKMALENRFDSGDLRLLTASNRIVYQSFAVKEYAILPTQKFKPGEVLIAPSESFNDDKRQVLFQGDYILKLVEGDLRLYTRFSSNGEKQYWSLKRTLFKGDLSKVAYAGIVTDVGGIGVFKSNGAVVWTSGKVNLQFENPHDTHFSVDADGNLRTHTLLKGHHWTPDFQAIANPCDLPDYCGQYGVCSKSKCSCLPGWVTNQAVEPRDTTKGCRTRAEFTLCGTRKKQRFVRFDGYETVFNQYATPSKITATVCTTKCMKDCSCRAVFYNANTNSCYVYNEVRTLKKVADSKRSVFLKV